MFKSVPTNDEKRSELTPPVFDSMTKSSSMGVTMMPRSDPNAELKIAAASLPPAAFVRITALETGGGMQDMALMPCNSHGLKPSRRSTGATTAQTKQGMQKSVKPWMRQCSGIFVTAPLSCWGLRDMPERKKMIETQPYFTVYSGNSGPPLAPTHGACLAPRIAAATPSSIQFFRRYASNARCLLTVPSMSFIESSFFEWSMLRDHANRRQRQNRGWNCES
mmetsp:Transcript_2854/g.8446  ORF Transcript_2854/g.8446 Transcript_2854/m.8446 type:complete len:221 (-) Transcript_2854:40-702(-)